MALISIIIPVWNHAAEALECLASLERQSFKDFEVVMVDDGSTDGLTEKLAGRSFSFPFRTTSFERNRGANAARNEGFRQAHGSFLLFLDADIVLVPDALQKMKAALDGRPDAAFAYPSFKFGWKLFRGRPFDGEALKERNYIHTSALIRREAFPGFDEALKKLQDWDVWLTMSERGAKGVWIPETLFTVKTRREGMSHWLPRFVYAIPWDVIGWSPKRVRRYNEAEETVLRKHGLWVEETRLERLAFRKSVLHWMLAIVGLEVLSALVIFHPLANAIAVLLAGLALFVLTLKRPSWALSCLAIELLIGSKGALLKIGGDQNNDGGVSLRIVLFATFLLGWFVWRCRKGGWRDVWALVWERKTYLVLAVVLIYGVVRGWMNGNGATIVPDANAWGTWLLLFPVLDVVRSQAREVKCDVSAAMLAGLLWLPIKTLALFYFFSHGFSSVSASVNLWVRRTGVGEVTFIRLNAFRIFFQSHIYAGFVLVAGFVWSAYRSKCPTWLRVLLLLSVAEILVSLSRSFWIGIAFGLFCAMVIVLRRTRGVPWFSLKRLSVATIGSLLLLAALLAFPIPPVDTSSLFSLISSRTNLSENAAVSRWQMIGALKKKIVEHPILGSGFGATVTYESKDPRIVEKTGGTYTTYAFEWGWLEHWIKLGIVGIPLLAWILWSLGSRLWRSKAPEWLRVASVCVLVTLAVIHVFTPYLNHPLGFLVLFVGEGMTVLFRKSEDVA